MLAAGGGTDDEYLTRIIKARHIYEATGKALYPWEVDDMPVDYMDAILCLQIDVPNKAERINKVKNAPSHSKNYR